MKRRNPSIVLAIVMAAAVVAAFLFYRLSSGGDDNVSSVPTAPGAAPSQPVPSQPVNVSPQSTNSAQKPADAVSQPQPTIIVPMTPSPTPIVPKVKAYVVGNLVWPADIEKWRAREWRITLQDGTIVEFRNEFGGRVVGWIQNNTLFFGMEKDPENPYVGACGNKATLTLPDGSIVEQRLGQVAITSDGKSGGSVDFSPVLGKVRSIRITVGSVLS